MRGRLALLGALCALATAGGARGQEGSERVVLRWQPVEGAAAYDLQVASDAAFTNRDVDRRVETSGTRLPPSVARRWWRVRAVDRDGRAGPWSAVKTIDPLARPPDAAKPPEPVAEPEPVLLAVPPLPPSELAAPEPLAPEARGRSAVDPPDVAELREPLVLAPGPGLEGFSVRDVLRGGRPAVLLGWRHDLLGVDSPVVTIEGAWRLPWLGADWGAAVRAGWWDARRDSRLGVGLVQPVEARADVFPVVFLVTRSFQRRWARLYAGAGGGVDLVLVRLSERGALEASVAGDVVAGAGRPLGPGEIFCELQGAVGGVGGPLGRLRTGGLALSIGYHLGR